jgi:hypothetical protein
VWRVMCKSCKSSYEGKVFSNIFIGQTDISRWKYKYMFTGTLQGCAFCPKASQQYFAYRRNFNFTDKKENQIFLIYKEIQHGAVAKSWKSFLTLYMRKCANICSFMRRPLVIYDFATAPFIHSFIHSYG